MNDEFVEIRDAARRALSGVFSIDELKKADVVRPELLDRFWNVAIEAGWTGLIIPERAGGVGLGMSAAIVVAEELGRACAPGSWGETFVLAPSLPIGDDYLAGIANGDIRVSLALGELEDDSLIALVNQPRSSTHFLLGFPGVQETELRLLSSKDIQNIRDHQPLDPGTPLASVSFPLEPNGIPIDLSSRAFDAFRLFAAAELIGVLRGAFSLSIEYAKTRTQFGVPIGSFQSIKHRLADIALAADAAALAVQDAARNWDFSTRSYPLDCAVAFDLAARAARDTCAVGIQIHGAIGVSWEHNMHLFFKRTRSIISVFQHRLLPRANLMNCIIESNY